MNGHNPDILTCLANLSADEVFTPPKLASAMLDILPQDLFRRPDTTFLDPVCKSGVFLREIARRLNDGLKDQMPDQQARINHILTKQVFGLATSELTALLSRRSVYCSKKADGKYSIATAFTKPDGNIRLPKTAHTWNASGKCESCGANQGEYDRDETFEAYASPFIHSIDLTDVNLSTRMHNRRYTRQTNAYSKKWANHKAMLCLQFARYNWCRKHMTIKTRHAVAAGLATEPWTLERLLTEAAKTVAA